MIAARYVNRELVIMFLVTMVVLFVVAVGGRFIGYLQDAAAGKYSADALATILQLRLPGFMQLLIPFASYLAILLTLGRLYADQEMAVLQGGGASPLRVLAWMAVPLLLLIAFESWLSLARTPQNNLEFTQFLIEQRTRQEFETVHPGVFNVFSRGDRVTYAERMSEDRQTLYNVFISEQAEQTPTVTIWAERGEQYVDENTGSRFLLLYDGRRYEGVVGGSDYRVIEFEQLGQRILIEEVVASAVEPDAQPTSELLASSEPADAAELHWRIALPIFMVIGSLMAVGLARVRPRQGRFARTVPGILAFLVYYFLLLLNQNALREATVPGWVGLWPVHLLFLGFALHTIRQVARPVKA